jgi:DnaK suppressor protein
MNAKALRDPENTGVLPGSRKYSEIAVALHRQRAELLQAVAGRPLSEGIEVTLCPDLNDQASAEIDQHFMLRLKERERNLLKQIDGALDRLATDRYGICEDCGEDIPVPRLKVRPMTTLCVDCKTLQEEQDKIRQ